MAMAVIPLEASFSVLPFRFLSMLEMVRIELNWLMGDLGVETSKKICDRLSENPLGLGRITKPR